MYSPTGTITSPGWPSNYPRNADCTWEIIAPVGQQIELNLVEIQLERHWDSCEHAFDYIEIRYIYLLMFCN